MQDILIKAGCYVGIILLGILLRRVGFFKESDFYLLSRVAIKITLPAAIVYSFAGKEFDLSLLSLALIASAAPGFTAELEGDTGLASAVNSISIVVSIVIIVALLLVML